MQDDRGFYPWSEDVLALHGRMKRRPFFFFPRFSRDAFGRLNVRWGRRLHTVWGWKP